MYFVKLPSKILSGPNKDKVSVIEITSAKSTVTDPNTGKPVGIRFGDTLSYVDSETGKEHIGIPAENWDYPQYGPEPSKNDKGEYQELTEEQAEEGVKEFVKDSGGWVRALENINDATQKVALNYGKNYIRTKENVTPESAPKVVEEGISRAHNFTWMAAERVTNKSVRESAEKLEENIEAMSKEEIIAQFRAMLGKGKAA